MSYLGNCALIKKGHHRLANDDAIYNHRGEQLSEHMFITGISMNDGSTIWIDGAAPSGCGKTTTAMAGDVFIGDDLAQIWIDSKGTIRSTNPEIGIFGIIKDVNIEGDPLLMERLRKKNHLVIKKQGLKNGKLSKNFMSVIIANTNGIRGMLIPPYL